MADMMMFPKTVDEFMEQYKIVDTDKVYTNGAELVPIFRMKQWFEHVEAEPIVRCKDCRFYDPLDANRPYDCLYMDSIFGDDYCSRGEKLPEPIIYPQVEGITPTVVKMDEVQE